VTAMVQWTPFRELDRMERSMRRMLGFDFAPMPPAADIYETKDEFVFELEVPGYKEKELAVELVDHVLTVKGEHLEKADEKEQKAFHLQERIEREFERRFELPSLVQTEKLTATFENGVLKLHAPKAEPVLPKKIPIAIN
jgi:HSP20 family protein